MFPTFFLPVEASGKERETVLQRSQPVSGLVCTRSKLAPCTPYVLVKSSDCLVHNTAQPIRRIRPPPQLLHDLPEIGRKT